MVKRGKPMTEKSFPWWQSGFDLEGIVGFLAGWLLGILLGMLWGPLFWIGFLPGVVLLFATRTAERVSPDDPFLVVTPCDGVVVSVEPADAPEELRLVGGMVRIRISSSPFSSNNIHAPIAGIIDHIIREEGAAEAFAAMKADSAGLEVLNITVAGPDGQVGVRVVTGGLGPRLESRADAGDRVVAGKTIATRRLGGWCDVYVPSDGQARVIPGQTLVGGETGLWTLSGDLPVPDDAGIDTLEEETIDVRTVEEQLPPEVPGDIADAAETRTNDPAEMFARLKREAGKLSGGQTED